MMSRRERDEEREERIHNEEIGDVLSSVADVNTNHLARKSDADLTTK